ncbi:MAG: methionyl-tRNA formyltransferase [Desulfatitalea sp.]
MQPSVVFMGTPDFAVPPLLALHAAGFRIPLVVTQPDRPKGRGRGLSAPPVKEAAQRLGYTVAQPLKVREPDFVACLQAVAPDFLVVVAFGQILPLNVLRIPKIGPINIHASLLPKYRGPAPIQWAMIRGERQTGVTTMLMDTGVDTGDILQQVTTDIRTDENADQLHCRLANMGAGLVVETLNRLRQGTVFPRAQKHDDATYAPLLKKEDGRIPWAQPAGRLDAFVRAMTPWPGAFCFWGDKRLKIILAHPINEVAHQTVPGTVVAGFPDELRVTAGQGVLLIEQIQGDSGKRMAVKEFLRGHPLPPGTVLT